MMTERYDALLEQAREAFATGELATAADLYDIAERCARDAGDSDRADRAACNACIARIEMGQAVDQVPILRRLFLGTLENRNRCTAAYNLAVAHVNLEDFESAMDWANRAGELAAAVDDPALTAGVFNQQATLSLRLSRFGEAEAGFGRALEAMNVLDNFDAANRATVLGNLGYALMCSERISEGLGLCEQARSDLETIEAEHLLYENLQDLCYGYILDDQLELACEAGERGLALAEQYEDLQVMKNCLFLLAEVAVRRGDTFRGRRYLRELAAFYPEIEMNDEIVEVFLATDLTTVVNLRG